MPRELTWVRVHSTQLVHSSTQLVYLLQILLTMLV